MKQLVKDVENEGMMALLGKRITVFCLNYIYTGNLVGVNTEFIKLEEAAIVYETGDFADKKWKDAQSLINPVYIMLSTIESFMILK